MNWTQPICERCYAAKYPDREPVRVKEADLERCSNCGLYSRGGIYYRADPREVNYPAAEDTE